MKGCFAGERGRREEGGRISREFFLDYNLNSKARF